MRTFCVFTIARSRVHSEINLIRGTPHFWDGHEQGLGEEQDMMILSETRRVAIISGIAL
jgi:hypothetical protein